MADSSLSHARASQIRFGLLLGAPTLLWQLCFFVVPLGFLIAMTFWSVRNFRLQPDFTLANWSTILSAGFFQSAYTYTFGLSALVAVFVSIAAFPVAYVLAFKLKPSTRALLAGLLVVPFFTSFPVRIYSMQIFFSPNGLINTALDAVGIGPISVLNSPTSPRRWSCCCRRSRWSRSTGNWWRPRTIFVAVPCAPSSRSSFRPPASGSSSPALSPSC